MLNIRYNMRGQQYNAIFTQVFNQVTEADSFFRIKTRCWFI